MWKFFLCEHSVNEVWLSRTALAFIICFFFQIYSQWDQREKNTVNRTVIVVRGKM